MNYSYSYKRKESRNIYSKYKHGGLCHCGMLFSLMYIILVFPLFLWIVNNQSLSLNSNIKLIRYSICFSLLFRVLHLEFLLGCMSEFFSLSSLYEFNFFFCAIIVVSLMHKRAPLFLNSLICFKKKILQGGQRKIKLDIVRGTNWY